MEEKCSICGNISSLFDVVGPEEIIRVCRQCAVREGLPVIKKADAGEEVYESKPVQETDISVRGVHKSKIRERL